MMSLDEAYAKLGLSSDASADAVERAFSELAENHRRDSGSDPWDFQEAQQAYEILTAQYKAAANVGPEHSQQVESTTPQHLVWKAFFKELPLQNETTYFILINMLDWFMTYIILQLNLGVEANPAAKYFLDHWGTDGMLLFKILAMTFVALLAQIIARWDLSAARRVLILGSIIVGFVVAYSLLLIQRGLTG